MAEVVLSSVRTTDGIVKTGAGHYYGCRLTGDGTNKATVLVYDGTDTGGTLIDALKVTADLSFGEQFAFPKKVSVGIYVDVTTPGQVVTWYR